MKKKQLLLIMLLLQSIYINSQQKSTLTNFRIFFTNSIFPCCKKAPKNSSEKLKKMESKNSISFLKKRKKTDEEHIDLYDPTKKIKPNTEINKKESIKFIQPIETEKINEIKDNKINEIKDNKANEIKNNKEELLKRAIPLHNNCIVKKPSEKYIENIEYFEYDLDGYQIPHKKNKKTPDIIEAPLRPRTKSERNIKIDESDNDESDESDESEIKDFYNNVISFNIDFKNFKKQLKLILKIIETNKDNPIKTKEDFILYINEKKKFKKFLDNERIYFSEYTNNLDEYLNIDKKTLDEMKEKAEGIIKKIEKNKKKLN